MDFSLQMFSPLVINSEIKESKKKKKKTEDKHDPDSLYESQEKGKIRSKKKSKSDRREKIAESQASDINGNEVTSPLVPPSDSLSDVEVDRDIIDIAANIHALKTPSGSESDQKAEMTTPKRKRRDSHSDLEELNMSQLTKRMRAGPGQECVTSTQTRATTKPRPLASQDSGSDDGHSQSILAGASPFLRGGTQSPVLFSDASLDELSSPPATPQKRGKKDSPKKGVMGACDVSQSDSQKLESSQKGPIPSTSGTRSPKKLLQKTRESHTLSGSPRKHSSRPCISSESGSDNSSDEETKPQKRSLTRARSMLSVQRTSMSESGDAEASRRSPRVKAIAGTLTKGQGIMSPRGRRLSSSKGGPVEKLYNSSSEDEESVNSPPPKPKERQLRYTCPEGFKEVKWKDPPLTNADLGPDKEIWCLRLPRNFDVNSLDGKAAVYNGVTDIDVESEGKTEKYQLHCQKIHPKNPKKAVLLVDEHEKVLRLGGHVVTQLWLTQSEPIPLPRPPHPRPFRVTTLPPGLKRRHVPFGTGVQSTSTPCIPASPKRHPPLQTVGSEESTEVPVDEVDAPQVKKKKKKKHRKEKEADADVVPEAVAEDSKLEAEAMEVGPNDNDTMPEVVSDSQRSHKKKKNKKKTREIEEINSESVSQDVPEVQISKKKKKKKHKEDRGEIDLVSSEVLSGVASDEKHSKKKKKSKDKDNDAVEAVKVEPVETGEIEIPKKKHKKKHKKKIEEVE